MRFLIIACLLITMFSVVTSINMQCKFQVGSKSRASSKFCNVEQFEVTSPNEIVTSINNQFGNHYHKDNVIILNIVSQTVHYMPKGIEKIFPDLETIQIFGSKLKSIKKEDIEPFKNLKQLFLTYNELESLDGNLFDSNRELTFINFNKNKIKFIGDNLVDPLTKLDKAFFTGNECLSKQYYDKTGVVELKKDIKTHCGEQAEGFDREVYNLKYENDLLKGKNIELQKQLDNVKVKCKALLEKCKQSATPKSSPASTTADEIKSLELKLQSCDGSLDAATNNLFWESKKLKACETSGVEVFDEGVEREVPTGVEMICECTGKSCRVINLPILSSNASIEIIKDKEDKQFIPKDITKVIIADQPALYVPSQLGYHFPHLIEFIIQGCGLYEVDSYAFKSMDNLNALVLSENKIREIIVNTFAELENLLTLDLSYNRLVWIEVGSFNGLGKLTSLKLNNNLLVTIKGLIFEGLKDLKKLELQNNKLKFIGADFLFGLHRLSTLDLLHNECINTGHPKESLAKITEIVKEKCAAPFDIYCKYVEEEIALNDDTKIKGFICKGEEKPSKPQQKPDPGKLAKVTIYIAPPQSSKPLPADLHTKFPNVEKIIIENSRITSLLKSEFRGFLVLRWIIIRHNNLLSIHHETFNDVNQTEYLDLSYNNLQALAPRIFTKLIMLKTLILSNNNLRILSANILPIGRKSSIEDFRASNNKLETIETRLLVPLGKSAYIDFTGNVCVDMKFDRNAKIRRCFGDVYAAIDLNCRLEVETFD